MSSLLNKAIYYWDWYLLHGEVDNLVSAYTFMKDYKRQGGEDYENTFQAMKDHLSTKISPLKKAGKAPEIIKQEEPEELTIFGYSYGQIAAMQGIKELR